MPQLPEQWRDHFPRPVWGGGSEEELREWRPYIRLHGLAPRALAVCTTRIEGAWCAYIAAVPGNDHRAEVVEVLNHGTKLLPEIARAMFPELAEVPYAL